MRNAAALLMPQLATRERAAGDGCVHAYPASVSDGIVFVRGAASTGWAEPSAANAPSGSTIGCARAADSTHPTRPSGANTDRLSSAPLRLSTSTTIDCVPVSARFFSSDANPESISAAATVDGTTAETRAGSASPSDAKTERLSAFALS